MTTVIDALATECGAFTTALDGIGPDEWTRTTNCPPWTVKELAAHVYGSTMVDPARLPSPAEGAPVIEAADYYRRDERDTVEYRSANVDRWQRFAAGFTDGREIIDACARDWPRMIATLRAEDPARLIRMTWDASMTLDDYLVSRVIGVAAHGVDLAITLDHPRWTTSEALEVVRPALVSLVGAELPDALGWTDQDLLEAGTGRRPLTADERTTLGPRADAFPLLS